MDLLLILLHFGFCVNDMVRITFLLISDLSGVLFSVTTLKIIDWIRLWKNGENPEVMFFIILFLDWYYNGIVSYLASL